MNAKRVAKVWWMLLVAQLGCSDDARSDLVDASIPDAGPTCEGPTPSPTACNGSDALCSRRYDEVVYLTSHNAYTNEAEGWILPNQGLSMDDQLALGVRGLMLDAQYHHQFTEEPYLCHSTCLTGEEPLADGLRRIADFLACHPREVITLILESRIDAADWRAAFEASGLIDELYDHPSPEAPWPTLESLIDGGTRVVALTDDSAGAGSFPGYLYVWDHAWEVPFSAASPDDLSCTTGRGDRDHTLWIFNHFLTDIGGSLALSNMVNHDPFLSERVNDCADAQGEVPNFITLDFVETGDGAALVDAWNARE